MTSRHLIAMFATSLTLGFSLAAQATEPRVRITLEPSTTKPAQPSAPACTNPCVQPYVDISNGTIVLGIPLEHPTR